MNHKQAYGLSRNINKINVYAGLTITLSVIEVSQDDFINIYSPDETYNYTNLQIYNGGLADSLYALLDFDLSAIAGKIIISATLKMYADALTLATTLGFKRIEGTWTEGVVTWNTRPNISGSYAAYNPSLGSGYKNFDLKTLVQSVSNGEDYYGIWVYVGNPVSDYRWCQFSSSEAENKPQLEVRYIA